MNLPSKPFAFAVAAVAGGLGFGMLASRARRPEPPSNPATASPNLGTPTAAGLPPRPSMQSLVVPEGGHPKVEEEVDRLLGTGSGPEEGTPSPSRQRTETGFEDPLAGAEGGTRAGRPQGGRLRDFGGAPGPAGGGFGGAGGPGGGGQNSPAAAAPGGSQLAAFPAGDPASAAGASRRAFDARLSRPGAPARSREAELETAPASQSFGVPVGDSMPSGSRAAPVKLPREPDLSQEPSGADAAGDGSSNSGSIDPRFGPEGPEGADIPKLYRLGHEGSTEWSEARALEPTLKAVKAELAKIDADYRVSVEDETSWSQPQNLGGAMGHLERRLKTRYVGDVVLVEKRRAFDKVGKIVRVRIVRRHPKPPLPADPPKPPPGPKPPPAANTAGTHAIDVQHGAVWAQFPDLESWGICNCRRIRGSSTWSQHAWCNAEDIHRDLAGKTVLQSLDPVHAWLQRNRARLNIEHLIYRAPDHWDHIHSDMRPNGRGTPPCAR